MWFSFENVSTKYGGIYSKKADSACIEAKFYLGFFFI